MNLAYTALRFFFHVTLSRAVRRPDGADTDT